MLRRRMLQVLIGFGLVAVSLLGANSAANAAPSSFLVQYVHGGGTGSLAAAGKGTMSWSNRSVVMSNIKIYAHALECVRLTAYGYAGTTGTGATMSREFCAPADRGEWFSEGDLSLTTSIAGGITRVELYIQDYDHNAEGSLTCYRSRAACS